MGDRRHLAGATAAALLIGTPVALVAPATADIDRDTAQISDSDVYVGQSFSITGRVTDNGTGAPCNGGTTTVYRDPAGSQGPRALSADTDGGDFAFTLKSTTNADYILHYSGNDTAGCPEDLGYFAQRVYRRMPSDVSQRGVMHGSVSPAWRRKPVVVQVKRGGRWVTHDKVRTNRRSRYSTKFYARPGKVTSFRAFVKDTVPFQRSFTTQWDVVYGRASSRGAAAPQVVARAVSGQSAG